MEFFLYVLGLQRKGNVFVDREVWIERIALEDHGDAAVAGTEVVNHASADEDFPGRGSFHPGDHPQKRPFSPAPGPTENQKPPFARFKVHLFYTSHFSLSSNPF